MKSINVLPRLNSSSGSGVQRQHITENETNLSHSRISFGNWRERIGKTITLVMRCNDQSGINNLIYFDIHFVREHFNCSMDDLVFWCAFSSCSSLHFIWCLSKVLNAPLSFTCDWVSTLRVRRKITPLIIIWTSSFDHFLLFFGFAFFCLFFFCGLLHCISFVFWMPNGASLSMLSVLSLP